MMTRERYAWKLYRKSFLYSPPRKRINGRLTSKKRRARPKTRPGARAFGRALVAPLVRPIFTNELMAGLVTVSKIENRP